MTTSDTGLLDTNILVYAADKSSPFHQTAVNLRDRGMNGVTSVCISPQVLNEFFAIITTPKRVANPRSQEEAREEMEKYLNSERILKIYPGGKVIREILELLKRYKVTRQEIFDLQLVATMLLNGVRRIYTYNSDDFDKYEEIEVLKPS